MCLCTTSALSTYIDSIASKKSIRGQANFFYICLYVSCTCLVSCQIKISFLHWSSSYFLQVINVFLESAFLLDVNKCPKGRDRLAQMVECSLRKNSYVGNWVRFSQPQDFFRCNFNCKNIWLRVFEICGRSHNLPNKYSWQVTYHLSEREHSLNKLVLWCLTDVVIYSTTLLYTTNTATHRSTSPTA